MPRISYFVMLQGEIDRIRIDFETEYGQVMEIYVVQYEAFLAGGWQPIVRYDTAHGFFHQDIYTARGRLKYRILIQDLGQALTYAIEDLRANWQRYRGEFTGG